jgi:hypothetical protein
MILIGFAIDKVTLDCARSHGTIRLADAAKRNFGFNTAMFNRLKADTDGAILGQPRFNLKEIKLNRAVLKRCADDKFFVGR